MIDESCDTRLAWYWIDTKLPRSWECTYFRPFHRDGQLQFHNRAGQCAVFRWRLVKKSPDIERTLLATRDRAIEQLDDEQRVPALESMRQYAVTACGSYHFAFGGGYVPSYGMAWDPESRMLVEWNFASHVSEALCRSILEPATFNNGPIRHWRLFGLRADLPVDYHPEEVSPLPANVSINFLKDRRQVTVRRWGLVETVKAGRSLGSFMGSYQKQLGRVVTSLDELTFLGRPAVQLVVEQRGEYSMEKLTGRWWKTTCIAWEQPEEKRLYAIEQTGPAKAERLDLNDVVPA